MGMCLKKGRKEAGGKKGTKKRAFAVGGVKTSHLAAFTRQLSILQNAGLPILRSLRILETQAKGGRLKNSLMDTCEEIESGSTLSEALAKSPKAFDRLYVNMIKAGEAGGALETILQRLADFLERAESLKRKVKGALIYPIVVVLVATMTRMKLFFYFYFYYHHQCYYCLYLMAWVLTQLPIVASFSFWNMKVKRKRGVVTMGWIVSVFWWSESSSFVSYYYYYYYFCH